MTLKQLNDFRKEIIILKNLEEEANIKADSVPGGNSNGMPSAKGNGNSKETRYMTYFSDKDGIKKRYEQMLRKHSETLKYIKGIEDHTTYLVFKYRFISGYSWNQTAMKVGGNTADSVRMMVNNYLKKH